MIDLTTLSETFAQGLAALRDPASNPLAALFVLAAIVLVLLIGVLIVYLAIITVEVRSGKASEESEPEQTNSRGAGVLWAISGALLLGAVSYGWTYSTTDAACAQCHYTADAIESHAEGTHADIACAKCHVGPGISAKVLARVRGARNWVAQLGGASGEEVSARVTNGACLECHGAVAEGVLVARSVSIRHSDLLDIGHACTDCHNTEGHGKTVDRPKYPRMSQCINCHDGAAVSATCSTCHNEDVGVAVRRPERPYAQSEIVRDDCRGCHPQDSCIACHGLELPHSKEFKTGFHARKALERPAMCTKCHDLYVFCNDCHRFQVSALGATSWKREHANMGDFVAWHSRGSGPGTESCRCHDTDRQKFCNYCHGPQPER